MLGNMAYDIEMSEDKYVLGALPVLITLLLAMIFGGAIGQIVFSIGTVLFFGLYLLMGTHSSEKRHGGRLFQILALGLIIILSIGFTILWYFHFQNPTYTNPIYWLGFPRATAVVIYLLWMPPALYLMFSYPYLFDKYIWSESQAEEFRQMNQGQGNTQNVEGDRQETPARSGDEGL